MRRCMPKPALFMIACAVLLTAAHAREVALPPAVTRAMNEAGVPAANVSIHVRDAASGEILIDLNAAKPRSPASTIKVLTNPTTLVVSGGLATSCGIYSISRAIMTAPDYAYGKFRTMWTQSGGAIDGAMRVAPLPAGAALLYAHDSLPLAEIIRLVNKFSNNVMARHLLLTLGAEKFGPPASARSGRNAVRLWLANRGVEIPGFVLENGAGLSRTERVTVLGLAEVLNLAWRSPFMPEFAASLPLAATDGTLSTRFGAAGMQGRLRLKTGSGSNHTGTRVWRVRLIAIAAVV